MPCLAPRFGWREFISKSRYLGFRRDVPESESGVSRSHAKPSLKTVRSGSHSKTKTPGKVERHHESGRPPAFPVSASHFLQQGLTDSESRSSEKELRGRRPIPV
jgi:hypothetical protein